jgi:hypothetical protein
MGRLTTSPCEFLLSPPCEPAAPHEETEDSRTSLKQYLLDPVLPIVTVLAIGALALVMLLLVVATVGDMEQALRSSGAGEDPWACAATATSPQAYAAYVTSADATQDADAWAGPPVEEPADARVAQGSTPR